ncbi:curli production assembly/transport component CsgE [Solimonas aquatica]|uniref:Curli production assembly/transport component CsgE n=1 Tax=Solimonas aquatica TaxID=489703 RepID=A0A1H9DLM9_9GAMM|nr:curli production assembly/transport component CsgE [Solimonas aquatica]
MLLLAALCAQAADIEVPGLLANETRTFAGREFYDSFATVWQAYDPDGRFSLTINEKPAARLGSLVTVLFNGQVVFQRFISFNARMARAVGADASGRVYSAVMSAQLNDMLKDSELLGDGL